MVQGGIMRQLVRQSIGGAIAVALLSAFFMWGHSSLSPSQASNLATSTPVAMTIGSAPSNGFTEVAKVVTPAVVNITTMSGEQVSDLRGVPDEWRDRLEEFFGGPEAPFGPRGFRGPQGGNPRERHEGSGVIVSPDGYILTNNHVIDGARTLTITLPDKREFDGTIIGTDPKTDL